VVAVNYQQVDVIEDDGTTGVRLRRVTLWGRKYPENVFVHTDRGVQYCSKDYRALLKRHNLQESMSAKACCYDNE